MSGNEDQAPDNGDATDWVSGILAELEVADFELVDPPPTVWEGIQAVIASEQARTPESPHERPDLSAGFVVVYRIDADDLVTEVGQGWAEFARDNDAPELVVPASDRKLWTYFDRDEVRELWRLVIEHVRTADRSPGATPL